MKANPWQEYLFRPLAVAAMFGCIAQALAGFLRLLDPTWNGAVLVVGSVLAALEAGYSYRLTRSETFRGRSLWRFRAVELALFFILLKIVNLAGRGWDGARAEMRAWPHDPLAIADTETLIAFVLAVAAWRAAIQTAHDFRRIGEPPEVSRFYTPPRESLASRFFTGGVVILILTGMSRIGFLQLFDLERPAIPGLVLNVLLYFLLGLVMLGQVQYTTLRNRWQARHIPIAGKLSDRWIRYSLILIGLAALVAFLLPTGYTMGLLNTAGNLLGLALGVFLFIMRILFLLLMIPLWLFFYLLFLLIGRPPPSRPMVFSPLEAPLPATGTPLSWLELLRSFVFWAVALGMVYYVIRSYLRDHPEILRSLAGAGPIRALLRILAALWRSLLGLAEAVGERIPHRLALRGTGGRPVQPGFRFFRLGALSFRERVLYYYLSILKRAGQLGYPRHHSQTPHEYDAVLEPHLPQAQAEMALLTEAFVEARYSRHPVDGEYVRRVQADWEQVKAALRALKRENVKRET